MRYHLFFLIKRKTMLETHFGNFIVTIFIIHPPNSLLVIAFLYISYKNNNTPQPIRSSAIKLDQIQLGNTIDKISAIPLATHSTPNNTCDWFRIKHPLLYMNITSRYPLYTLNLCKIIYF